MGGGKKEHASHHYSSYSANVGDKEAGRVGETPPQGYSNRSE